MLVAAKLLTNPPLYPASYAIVWQVALKVKVLPLSRTRFSGFLRPYQHPPLHLIGQIRSNDKGIPARMLDYHAQIRIPNSTRWIAAGDSGKEIKGEN